MTSLAIVPVKRKTAKRINQPKKKSQKKQSSSTSSIVLHNAPIAKSVRMKLGGPKMSHAKNGNFTVSHKELCVDLLQPGIGTFWQLCFAGAGVPINPGNSELFPWLSQVASRFESYRFSKLKFSFEPLYPTTQVGTVEFAVDYDAADAPPTSKQQMASYVGFQRTMIWDRMTMVCDPKDMNKLPQRYVLGDFPPANTDLRVYNVGNLYVAIFGSLLASALIFGELWVEYTVELMTPQIAQPSTGSFSSINAGRNSTTNPLDFNGGTPGIAFTPSVQNPLKFTSGNSFAIDEPGRYKMDFQTVYSGLANGAGVPNIVTPAPPNTWSQMPTYNGGTGSSAGFVTGILNVIRAGTQYLNTVDLAPGGAGTITSNVVRLAEYAIGL
jgi:hypothetical protein